MKISKTSRLGTRKKAVWGRSIVAAAAVLVFAVPVSAQSNGSGDQPKVDKAVQEAVREGKSARVIMQFDTQAERDAAFNRLLNRGAAVRTMDTEGGPALNVASSAAALSTELGNASRVSIDARVKIDAAKRTAAKKAAARGSKSAAAKAATAAKKPARDKVVRANAVRASRSRRWAPAPMSVAVIDSGVQPQEDLPLDRIAYFKDFVTGGKVPVDFCGHGTHVAGTVAGSGEESGGLYAGVDPNIDLVVLRVLGDDCSGNTSDVIDALEWIARNHRRYNIKVVNLSLGHPVFEPLATDPLVQAVERLSRKGIVVVTAAGNMGINPATGKVGYGGVGVPCNAPSAVCVGALDTKGTNDLSDDSIANFSSRGPSRFDLLAKPDIAADGVNVVSLGATNSVLYKGNPLKHVANEGDDKSSKQEDAGSLTADGPAYDLTRDAPYLKLSGTSMASPKVAGAAALVLTAQPHLSANMVKLVLQFTARTLDGEDTLAQGAGALNIGGAVTLASLINPAVPAGQQWLTAVPAVSNLDENGQSVTWGQRIVYGDRFMPSDTAFVHMARWDDNIVWGFDTLFDNIVWGNAYDDNIVWGNAFDNIVWGNAWDDNIVWGNAWDDNIVWGENIVWGNNIVWGYWADNIVWGFWSDNIVWGNVTRDDFDNIVWGNAWDNIVWGNCTNARMSNDDNVIWGNAWDDGDNIVWGFAFDDDNIVWGNGCSGKGSVKRVQ